MIEMKQFANFSQLDSFCVDNLGRDQIISIQRDLTVMPSTGEVAISFTLFYFKNSY